MSPISEYLAIALGLALLALGGMTKLWLSERDDFASYRGSVEALGKAAEDHTKQQITIDKQRKEIADAENVRLSSELLEFKRVRDAKHRSSFVPNTPACTGSPQNASLNRAILERAISDFTGAVQGLVDTGSQAVIDLNSAKAWAQHQ